MKNYNINDYSIFTAAANTTTGRVQMLNNIFNSINNEITKLNSEEVFMGPISDSVMSGWSTINPSLFKSINDLGKVITYVNSAVSIYKVTDTKNANEIGGVSNGQ